MPTRSGARSLRRDEAGRRGVTRPARRQLSGSRQGPPARARRAAPALMRVFTEVEAYDEECFPETSRVKRRLRETEEG